MRLSKAQSTLQNASLVPAWLAITKYKQGEQKKEGDIKRKRLPNLRK
jgi:hypothetical protein